MRVSISRLIGGLLAGGVLTLLAAGAVQAQDPSRDPILQELKARMDKLEQKNVELEKNNAELRKQVEQKAQHPVQAGPEPVEGGGKAPLTQQDVQKMIDEALKSQPAPAPAAAPASGGDKKSDQSQFYQVGTDFNLHAKYKDGRFWVENSHKDFGLWTGGYIQYDWLWNGVPSRIAGDFTSAGGASPFQDSSYPRRARIDMFGYAWEQLEWGVELDFENNPLNTPFANTVNPTPAGGTFPATGGDAPAIAFTDLWAGVKDIPFLGTVRAGHIRNAIGLENYSSSMAISFMERGSNFDAFMQEFQMGVQGFNSWFDERLNLAWTVARTDPGFLQYGVDVGEGDLSVTGSIRGLPIWYNNGRCFLHLAADYQFRTGEFDPNAAGGFNYDVRYRARANMHDEFIMPRLIDTGNLFADQNHIMTLEALLVMGSFHLQSEFTNVFVPNASASGHDGNLTFEDFYIYAGYFLTGESRAYDKRMCRLGSVQQPIEPFFWVRGEDGHHHWGWGAWEVLFRYDVINLNSNFVRAGSMETYTAAINWYLNPQLKIQLNYVAADREIDAPKQSGLLNFFGVRMQLNF
jgi:phosphate-selective porin OprO/OprP